MIRLRIKFRNILGFNFRNESRLCDLMIYNRVISTLLHLVGQSLDMQLAMHAMHACPSVLQWGLLNRTRSTPLRSYEIYKPHKLSKAGRGRSSDGIVNFMWRHSLFLHQRSNIVRKRSLSRSILTNYLLDIVLNSISLKCSNAVLSPLSVVPPLQMFASSV